MGVEHGDLSAILQELVSLRYEVRAVKELRAELATIHSTMTSVAVQQQFQTARNESLRTDQHTSHTSLLDTAVHLPSMLDVAEFPPLSVSGAHGNFNDVATASSSQAVELRHNSLIWLPSLKIPVEFNVSQRQRCRRR